MEADEGLEEHASLANELREKHHGDVITHSSNVFFPVTDLCRNACAYCGFRKGEKEGRIMAEKEVETLARRGIQRGCKEALFTFGERPEVYAKMRCFLKERGHRDFIGYVSSLCETALSFGLLPHTNAGVLARQDLERLREVNASLGLMLECASERLLEAGMPHELSPGKAPELRLGTIEDAGKLKIPFTTGLLIGIGETGSEIVDSLLALKKLNDRYGHLQEIIIQNFIPKAGTPMGSHVPPEPDRIIRTVVATRLLFKDVSVQVPPNLAGGILTGLIEAGANDLGGISPLTQDYINPEHCWPRMNELRGIVEGIGLKFRERLPIYPKFIKGGQYPYRLEKLIEEYADSEGMVR